MIRLTSYITIGSNTFDFLSEVEINSSWENITDTATIVLPRTVFAKNDGGKYIDSIVELFKRNDEVSIQLGYDFKLPERYRGVVSRVVPKVPLTIYCEDDMWRLKQTTIKGYSVESTSIQSMLSEILPIDPRTGVQYAFEADDITIGKFKIEKASVVETFDYLKRQFGLTIYLRDGKIFVGLAYQTKTLGDIVVSDAPIFHFQKNIISDSLQWFDEKDIRYRITAVNIKPDNTRTTKDFGDPTGELRTFSFYNVPDSSLEKMATDMLNRYKYTGFRGSFLTFLEPEVRHGDVVRLVDNINPDRNGYYLVKAVVTTAGMGGGRQSITLDRKIS